jgi:single-strand DNA-binding protein
MRTVSDLNQIVISGRLTRDPEARGGGNVAAFSLASNRQYQQNGEWKEEVVYVDVTAFSHLAGRVIERLLKGATVTVAGRLELNRWQTEDGSNRSQLRVIASNIQSPSFAKKDGATPAPAVAETAEEPSEELPVAVGASGAEDDIPF